MRSRTLILSCALLACAPPTAKSSPESAARAEPLWSATLGQPAISRADPSALLLPSGQVLLAGGSTPAGPTAAVELFNPSTETWSPGPALSSAEVKPLLEAYSTVATVVGGSGAEAFAGASWQPLSSPAFVHESSRGATLADGRLFVAGGLGAAASQAELLQLDGGWSVVPATQAPHFEHSVTRLSNGSVAVIGGSVATAEVFDPVSGTWLSRPGPDRRLHTATLLGSGQLLLVGGRSLFDGGIAGPERYNPVSGLSTPVPGLRVPRLSHAAVSLPGGDVLVIGGEGAAAARSAERYVAVLDRFVASGCLQTPRSRLAALQLTDGGVLVAAGLGLDGGWLQRSEKLDVSRGLLAQGQACTFDCECGTGTCADGVCCDSVCTGACTACAAARGALVDGQCTLVGPSRICRGSVGACDAEERCTGTDAGCPPDGRVDAGASCRSAVSPCDVADTCDGISTQCQADRVADAGTPCRAVAGVCDVADVCTGSSPTCPFDRVVDAGVPCRAATLVCDVPESCDGLAPQCPVDRFVDAGTVCRTSDGGCDLVETCSGTAAACPADAIAFPGAVCRPIAGPCDVPEVCLGGKACPADAVRDAGVLCRAASLVCDVADFCDGVTGGCTDAFADAGKPCRGAVGPCDAPEACSGAAAACPLDVRFDAGTPCRPAAGGCDAVEACDGVSLLCPLDAWLESGAECRPGASFCDVPETCTGTSVCPPDVVVDAGTLCRAAAGVCDLEERCDGTPLCPADALRAEGSVCRMSAGNCDLAEACSGAGVDCPPDALAAPETQCRPSTGECDPAEQCGGALDCPADVVRECDGGTGEPPSKPKQYVGWSCASAQGAPLVLLFLLPLLGMRRRLKAPVLALALLVPVTARAEGAVVSDFAIRVQGVLIRDLLASRLGGEIGGNVTLSSQLDVGAALSLGSALGARAGLTWHLKDDGEWVRPFIQIRALIHPVAEGIAGGAGAWAGIFVPLGPGRLQGGALFEAYAGPKGYTPFDVFLTIGYELDVYRTIEREGLKADATAAGEPEVPPLRPEPLAEPQRPEPAAETPPESNETTPYDPPSERVTTRVRISLGKDFLTFDERRANPDPKGEATIRRVTEVLKRYPQLLRVEVSGHADDGDSYDECMRISLKRAEAVLRMLLAAGIDPLRLTARGYGNTRLRVSAEGPARKRDLNRRVDFTVLEQKAD